MRFFLPAILAAVALAPPAVAADRPNVVLIVADDLGWRDLGCYGSTFYRTPHIDRLAKDGIRFTDFYAACPVCSPTRAMNPTTSPTVQPMMYKGLRALSPNHIPTQHKAMMSKTLTTGAIAI